MADTVVSELKLEPTQVQEVSGNVVAAIHSDWLQYLFKHGVVPSARDLNLPPSCWDKLPPKPAYERVDAPWKRLEIEVIAKPKSGKLLVPRILSKWLMKGDLGFVDFMQCLAKQNYLSQWEKMYQKHALLQVANKNEDFNTEDSVMELKEALRLLFNCQVFKTSQLDTSQDSDKTAAVSTQLPSTQQHPNMMSVLCIIDSPHNLYIIRPHFEHTLHDCITFSPAMLGNSYAKPLFVIYQIMKAFDYCHQLGVPCGNVTLKDFAMDKNLWVQFHGPKWKDVVKETKDAETGIANCAEEKLDDFPVCHLGGSVAGGENEKNVLAEKMLPEIVLQWVKGKLSNFDYLIILNSLAGRHMSNPNHHPVLPWVMDFTRSDSGYRDLSKSKYRLTKGDHQLDFMYESFQNPSTSPTSDSSLQVPHHISDVLSEITYYVYTARRTPKSVLCTHVRSTWVPNEYPSSMQRLQEWSPDECIPEFFTDPEIFRSIHEDLPDLEVPSWCSGPKDFISKHRAVLESDYVSDRLHRWIDLTFGYKLTGGAAVRAKNVCLQLVDQHTNPTNHGAVQLFNFPHPRRLTPSPYMAPSPPAMTRKHPRVDQSGHARIDTDVVQADSASSGQSRKISDAMPAMAAMETNPELVLQSDGTVLGTGTDSGSIGSATELCRSVKTSEKIAWDVNLEVSQSTMETISIISGGGGVTGGGAAGGANKPTSSDILLSLPQPVQPMMGQPADEMSLLKNPIKKLPFFRSRADTLTEAKPPIVRPEHAAISLPDDYDPLAALGQLESLYSFSSKALQGLPFERSEPYHTDDSVSLLGGDMHVLGCLIMELFLAPKLRMQHFNVSVVERCKLLRRVLETEWLDLPRAVRQVVRLLLEIDTKPNPAQFTDCLYKQPVMGLSLPTANMLLQPTAEIISFPSYLPNLYKMLSGFATRMGSTVSTSKIDQKKQSIAKINHVSRYLPKVTRHLTTEGRNLLFPYLLELFSSPDTALYASLLLLVKVAKFMGPQQATRKLLSCLTQVYETEFNSPNFMLLFVKSYLVQLMVWLGLDPFLTHITGYIVDAVTGLKECPEFGTTMDDQISIIAEDKKDQSVSMDTDSLDMMNLEDDGDLSAGDGVEMPLDNQEEVESENSSSDDDLVDIYQSESTRKNSEGTDTSSLEQMGISEGTQEETTNNENKASSRSNTPPDDLKDLVESSQASDEISEERTVKEAQGPSLKDPESKDKTPPKVNSDEHLNNNSTESEHPLDSQNSSEEVSTKLDSNDHPSQDSADPEPKQEVDFDQPLETEEDLMHEYLMSSLTKGRMTSLGNLSPGTRLVDVASESVTWLARRLGPALTATFLTKRLLKALKTCYMGAHLLSYCDLDSDSESSDDEYGVYIEQRTVVGDSNAKPVLGCLTDVAVLYGDSFIFQQYFKHIQETVGGVRYKVNPKAEAGLVSSVALFRHLLPFLTDTQVMDKLKFIFRKILQPLVNVVQSCQLSFPNGGQARAVICYKLIDIMTTIGLRIGREMAREHMTGTLQHFFVSFELVHGDGQQQRKIPPDLGRRYSHQFSQSTDSEDMYCEIKVDSQTNQYKIGTPTRLEHLNGETMLSPRITTHIADGDNLDDTHNVDPEIMKELREAFSPEMANTAYIPLCRLTGSIHMERILYNYDLIWKLSNQHERTLAARKASVTMSSEGSQQTEEVEQSQTSWFVDIGALDSKDDPLHVTSTTNAQVVGNRIDITKYSSDSDSDREEAVANNPVRLTTRLKSKRQSPSSKMGKSKRQLRGGWLSYWEGYCENDPNALLTFTQIKLQTFVGHTGGVKALYAMDNENSFMSASKDKTVKLWSLRNQGNGSGKSSCRYTYHHHRKSVFAVTFLESQRLVASCDGNIHLWDPFTGGLVHRYDLTKFAPNLLVRMPPPSPVLVIATAESSVRLIDTRSSGVQQELKVASGTLGLIRSVAVSPGSTTLGVGLSSGVISMVDLSSGLLLGGWRAHEGEIMQIKACSGNRFLTSSVDHSMALWREDGTRVCTFRGAMEPVHCMCICNGQIVSATTSNRIGLHTSLDQQASFSSHRVRSDLVKGMITTLDVMPLNRLFLLGSDNGTVTLLA